MLRSVIENYLISSKEIQLFAPFNLLLVRQGYYDIHLIHGPLEFGKDFIAKRKSGKKEIQYIFQLKAGSIDLSRFNSEVKPQLLEALTNNLAHPNFNKKRTIQVVFVLFGNIKNQASISFQQFNEYVKNTLKSSAIIIWDINKLTQDFQTVGIEAFFNFHKNPLLVSSFYNEYAKVKNQELLSTFDIYEYTNRWLVLDMENNINQFQIIFETYLFSTMLVDQNLYYEALLYVAHLHRIILKTNHHEKIVKIITNYLEFLTTSFYLTNKSYFREPDTLIFNSGLFDIFHYPRKCLQFIEILSLSILLSTKDDSNIIKAFLILLEEKGTYRILSDNYAITIILIYLVLKKINKLILFKKYITNTAVWLCDRYENFGLSQIGATFQDELEQLTSEVIEGLSYQKNVCSFAASIILDLVSKLKDDQMLSNIINDFQSVGLILEYYHFENEKDIFNYENSIIQTECDYKKIFESNNSQYIGFRYQYDPINISTDEAILLMFCLRDRYFPEIIFKIK